ERAAPTDRPCGGCAQLRSGRHRSCSGQLRRREPETSAGNCESIRYHDPHPHQQRPSGLRTRRRGLVGRTGCGCCRTGVDAEGLPRVSELQEEPTATAGLRPVRPEQDTERTTQMSQGIRVGTAPDSWGVWFPEDPVQVPWDRFLDEAAEAGYTWIELGPYGYLPTDNGRVKTELSKRNLKLSAATVFTDFHRGDDKWQRAWDQALAVAGLASQLGAEHLVVIPDLWRSDATGEALEPRQLSNEQWQKLAAGHDRLGKALLEEFGMKQQFHSHADSHVGTYREVERFLIETDERYTNLCLDTGHFAYYGGDNLKLIKQYPSRVGYLHLK